MKFIRRVIAKLFLLMHDVHHSARTADELQTALDRHYELSKGKLDEITKTLGGIKDLGVVTELLHSIKDSLPPLHSSRTPGGFYDENGYYVFRKAFSAEAVSNVQKALQAEVFSSTQPLLRHPSCQFEPNTFEVASSGAKIVKNALLNPHLMTETPQLAKAIENLALNENMANLLSSIYGRGHYTIHQTILFFSSPTTELHIDGWGIDTWPRGYAHTIWVPLEPIPLSNAPIFVMPWKRGHFLEPEAMGLKNFYNRIMASRSEAYQSYHKGLLAYIAEQNTGFVIPDPQPRDCVVFSSLTPHGTIPYNTNGVPSRMALQIILRPTECNWTWLPGGFNGEFARPPDGSKNTKIINDRWNAYFLPSSLYKDEAYTKEVTS